MVYKALSHSLSHLITSSSPFLHFLVSLYCNILPCLTGLFSFLVFTLAHKFCPIIQVSQYLHTSVQKGGVIKVCHIKSSQCSESLFFLLFFGKIKKKFSIVGLFHCDFFTPSIQWFPAKGETGFSEGEGESGKVFRPTGRRQK